MEREHTPTLAEVTTKVVGDRYELGDLLGSGGMGQVWRAYDRRLGRWVALKLLSIDVPDTRSRQRFSREAQAAASFSHPNAVIVYDFGEEDNRPYIVMELVEGSTLADLLAERGALPGPEAVSIGEQVLDALGAAHHKGLVHRDVKPSNVLLTPEGRVKLADFGIAKAVGAAASGLTATGEVLGTPHYLSPEQAAGEPATPRSDLYATGVLLYEMLAGTPPFTGESPLAVALAHQRTAPPPLRGRADVDPALATAVERALEKDPDRRYPDATSMRAALRGQSADVPTSAAVATTAALRPDRTAVLTSEPLLGARWRRRVERRTLWPVWTVLAVLLLLIVGLMLASTNGEDMTATGPSTTGAPPTTARVTTTTEPATTTSTTPPTTTTSRSATTAATFSPEAVALAALAQQVSSNPQSYGRRGTDLAAALNNVQRANPRQQPDRAEDAIEDIEEWMAAGELDPGIGLASIQILQSIAD